MNYCPSVRGIARSMNRDRGVFIKGRGGYGASKAPEHMPTKFKKPGGHRPSLLSRWVDRISKGAVVRRSLRGA